MPKQVLVKKGVVAEVGALPALLQFTDEKGVVHGRIHEDGSLVTHTLTWLGYGLNDEPVTSISILPGTGVYRYRMPFRGRVLRVAADLIASSQGPDLVTIDVKINGSTIWPDTDQLLALPVVPRIGEDDAPSFAVQTAIGAGTFNIGDTFTVDIVHTSDNEEDHYVGVGLSVQVVCLVDNS